MEVWIVVHDYCQLFIHSHTHWMCCISVMIPSGHMTSILLSIQERDPPLLLSWRVLTFFFPPERFFSIFWPFFLIRCEVKGQGCRMWTDCKAIWGKLVFYDNGLYKINWIELSFYSRAQMSNRSTSGDDPVLCTGQQDRFSCRGHESVPHHFVNVCVVPSFREDIRIESCTLLTSRRLEV